MSDLSTYSSLKVELIAEGDQTGTWGDTTNTNLGTALEEAIVGQATVNMPSDGDYTLPWIDSNASQAARNFVLNVTSAVALTATRNVIVPTFEKPYIVKNNTTGGQSIVIKTAAGTGITIANGSSNFLYVDGTNVGYAYTGATFNNAQLTGIPTAPTAANGTNTTQIATTAFVQNATGTLGTMSQQNANNVNISGGAITGTTINSITVGSNASGNRTVSTSGPSGGSNGDIWYQV